MLKPTAILSLDSSIVSKTQIFKENIQTEELYVIRKHNNTDRIMANH